MPSEKYEQLLATVQRRQKEIERLRAELSGSAKRQLLQDVRESYVSEGLDPENAVNFLKQHRDGAWVWSDVDTDIQAIKQLQEEAQKHEKKSRLRGWFRPTGG